MRISYKVIVRKMGSATLSPQTPGPLRDQSRWGPFRTASIVTLGLSIIIAWLLAAFVITLVLAIPLMTVLLYSLGRVWWRRRRRIPTPLS